MLLKRRKCKFCKQTGEISNMVEIKEGIPKSYFGWYHTYCTEPFYKERARIDKDNQEKNELWNLIKEIHGVITVENSWVWDIFAAWRKGKTDHGAKKPNVPIEYKVLTEAYKLSRKQIEYAKKTKQFDTVEAEMKYCYKIMCGKINDAYKKVKLNKQRSIKQSENVNENITKREVAAYKPKKSKGDISEFVDD